MTIKLLVTAVVAIVIIIEDSHENLAINPVLIPVQILAQDIIITTLVKTSLQIMIVIDLDMIKITKTPHVHITLLALKLIQPHLVVHIKLTIVLANALLAVTIPLLDPLNHHTALLRRPRSDRYRNRSHSYSRKCSNSQLKPTINLTQQPVPNIHHSSSTEPKFEINMYHPNTS